MRFRGAWPRRVCLRLAERLGFRGPGGPAEAPFASRISLRYDIVMKCKVCKKRLTPERGRPPRYCSAACRQKAYRQRVADPHRMPLLHLADDIDKVSTKMRYVRGLEALGFAVTLKPLLKTERPQQPPLRIVSSTHPATKEEPSSS